MNITNSLSCSVSKQTQTQHNSISNVIFRFYFTLYTFQPWHLSQVRAEDSIFMPIYFRTLEWVRDQILFRFIYPFISSSFICFVTDILCSVILRSLTRQLQKMLWLLSTSLNFIRFIIYFNDLNPFNFELVINCSFIFDSDRVCVLYNVHRTSYIANTMRIIFID